ncbi:MAG: polymorphic toxin-type HINT domain-containing protein [Bacteroidota bacterium]
MDKLDFSVFLDGQEKQVSQYLLTKLNESSTTADLLFFFNYINLPFSEMRAVSECMGAQMQMEERRLDLLLSKFKNLVKVLPSTQQTLAEFKKKTLESVFDERFVAANNLLPLKDSLEHVYFMNEEAFGIWKVLRFQENAGCMYYGLDYPVRKFLIGQLINGSTFFWYTSPKKKEDGPGVTQPKPAFILGQLIQNTPDDQVVRLLTDLAANNSAWLKILWEAAHNNFRKTAPEEFQLPENQYWVLPPAQLSKVAFQDVQGVFVAIRNWVASHYNDLGVPRTTVPQFNYTMNLANQTMNFQMTEYPAGNKTFYLGYRKEEDIFQNDQVYLANKPTADFGSDNGRIYFQQSIMQRPAVAIGTNNYEYVEPFYEYNFHPYEPISLQLMNYHTELPFLKDGQSFTDIALMGMLYQDRINKKHFDDLLNQLGNNVSILTAIVSFPIAGTGTTINLIGRGITAVNGAISAIDNEVASFEDSISSQEVLNKYQGFLNDWKKFKATADIVDFASPFALSGLSSAGRALRTRFANQWNAVAGHVNSFKNASGVTDIMPRAVVRHYDAMLRQLGATPGAPVESLNFGRLVSSGTLELKPDDLAKVTANADGMTSVRSLAGVNKVKIGDLEFSIPAGRIRTNGAGKFYVPGFCFVAGTPIQLPDGTTIAIEEVAEGDWVSSYNHDAEQVEPAQVTKLFRKTVNRLTRLTVGGALFLSTLNHPFYANGQYIEAQDLHVGDSILTRDGSYAFVEALAFQDTTVSVHNFEVVGPHNYYVGDQGLLVHNDCEFLSLYNHIEDLQNAALKAALPKYFDNIKNLPSGTISELGKKINTLQADPAALQRALDEFSTFEAGFLTKVATDDDFFSAWKAIAGLPDEYKGKISFYEQVISLQPSVIFRDKNDWVTFGELLTDLKKNKQLENTLFMIEYSLENFKAIPGLKVRVSGKLTEPVVGLVHQGSLFPTDVVGKPTIIGKSDMRPGIDTDEFDAQAVNLISGFTSNDLPLIPQWSLGFDNSTVWAMNYPRLPGVLDLNLHGTLWGTDFKFAVKLMDDKGPSIVISLEQMLYIIKSDPRYSQARAIRVFACHSGNAGNVLAKHFDLPTLTAQDAIKIGDDGKMFTQVGDLVVYLPDGYVFPNNSWASTVFPNLKSGLGSDEIAKFSNNTNWNLPTNNGAHVFFTEEAGKQFANIIVEGRLNKVDLSSTANLQNKLDELIPDQTTPIWLLSGDNETGVLAFSQKAGTRTVYATQDHVVLRSNGTVRTIPVQPEGGMSNWQAYQSGKRMDNLPDKPGDPFVHEIGIDVVVLGKLDDEGVRYIRHYYS